MPCHRCPSGERTDPDHDSDQADHLGHQGDTDVQQRCYLLHTCYMKTGSSSKLAALTFKVTLNVAVVQLQVEL